MFTLEDHKTVLEFVSDLENIQDDRAEKVIDAIDKGLSTDCLMNQVEIGMKLIFEKHGFDHYYKYESSFGITIFWRDKDQSFYQSELKKINL